MTNPIAIASILAGVSPPHDDESGAEAEDDWRERRDIRRDNSAHGPYVHKVRQRHVCKHYCDSESESGCRSGTM